MVGSLRATLPEAEQNIKFTCPSTLLLVPYTLAKTETTLEVLGYLADGGPQNTYSIREVRFWRRKEENELKEKGNKRKMKK